MPLYTDCYSFTILQTTHRKIKTRIGPRRECAACFLPTDRVCRCSYEQSNYRPIHEFILRQFLGGLLSQLRWRRCTRRIAICDGHKQRKKLARKLVGNTIVTIHITTHICVTTHIHIPAGVRIFVMVGEQKHWPLSCICIQICMVC